MINAMACMAIGFLWGVAIIATGSMEASLAYAICATIAMCSANICAAISGAKK